MTFQHRSASFRQLVLPILALALMAVFTLLASPASAQEFTLKFATQTINDIQHEYMKVFKAELEKASNGKIKVEIYPASQLGNFQRMMEGIRLGTIEAIVAPAEFYVAVDPRYQAIAMSGLWGPNEHAIKILNLPETRKTIAALGEGRGYVTASFLPYDTQLIGSKTPITKLADFAGKRIRVLASEAEQAQVKALGASTVPMALQEVLPALQQGTIDGVNAVMTVFTAFRYYDSAPNILETRLWSLISTTVISKIFLDKLPPDLQKIVTETAVKIEPQINQWQVARLAADRDVWTKNNGKFVKLSDAEQAEAQKRVLEAIQPMFAKDAGLKAFYDKLKTLAASVK
jgi:TRAP-type C4-dicarboxylate transport system substrate-binding protein